MTIFKFDLWDEVQETITGCKGVVIARTQWLNGCLRYQIQSKKLTKDGVPVGHEAFDEQQLKLIKKAKKQVPIPMTQQGVTFPGGPHDNEQSTRALK